MIFDCTNHIIILKLRNLYVLYKYIILYTFSFSQIDGDTDVENVQLEFANALFQLMKWVRRKEEVNADEANQDQDSGVQNSEHPNWMAPGNINGGQKIESYQNGIERIPNGIVKQIENQLNGTAIIYINYIFKICIQFLIHLIFNAN